MSLKKLRLNNPMMSFNRQVWQALKKIPRGKVTTYKEIAKYLKRPKAARAVGNACHKNPFAPQAPCHRVVKSGGRLGGYAGGTKNKINMLRGEGVRVERGKILDFNKLFFEYSRKSKIKSQKSK